MENKKRLLFASRAYESPPQEGGFVLLSDIARAIRIDNCDVAAFSTKQEQLDNLHLEKAFSKPGWSKLSRFEFALGLRRYAHHYDVVHTAHIPTKQNVRLLRLAIRRARRGRKTTFIQTITGLPHVTDAKLIELLWGDILVCQSPTNYQRIRSLTDKPVSLVVPWPSPKRVSPDSTRRLNTRKQYLDGQQKLVVFPGEFQRMGVDSEFSQALQVVLDHHPDCKIILACRFDTAGIGDSISQKFSGHVISIGKSDKIIELLEAADLVIFPTRKMEQKFHPPLIITEALSVGTPTLVSDLVDIDPSTSPLLTKSSATDWRQFGEDMSKSLSNIAHNPSASKKNFQNMVTAYHDIYTQALERA